MAKGCVYIPKTGKDAGKVFGSKETLAAHMNYTPALADMMAKYQKADGKMDVDSVTKWLTDNGYIKAAAAKPTTKKTEPTKKPTEKKPTAKKEFPKAPVTDVVKSALKSVDNTTAAIMNLSKVLPSVYESLVKQVKLSIGKPASQQIAEAYHNAVENGVEPELVAAVENAVALQEQMKSKPSLAEGIETNETLEVEGVPMGTRASNKASIDALERKHSDNATKKSVIAMVKKAARTLKSVFPSMDIHVHEDSKQYAAAMNGLKGQINSSGNFSYTTSNDGTIVGRIDINLSNATPKTVVHEVTHAILLKTFGDNSAVFLDFRKNIEKIISASGNKRLSDFADQYKEIGVEEIGQAEEYLAELAGMLSDKQTPLEYGIVRKIAELINKLVSTVTFDRFQPFQDLQDQKDTLEFFNTIAQSIKAGTAVEDAFVGKRAEFSLKGIKSKSSLTSQQIAERTEAKTKAGEVQPSMQLTAKRDKKEVITYSGPASIEALKENKPDMYVSRAVELSKTHLVKGDVGEFSKTLTSEEKIKWADKVYSKAKETVVSNLLFVYDNITPDVRNISKLWYDGANIIAQEMADKYNVTLEQASAVIATQSPQKPWFDNVHLAHFILDFYANNQNTIFEQSDYDYYKSKTVDGTGKPYPKQIAYLPELQKAIGKPFSELSGYDKSAMTRARFDQNYERNAPLRIPTGTIVDAKIKSPSSFSGYDTIAKAVSIIQDGSKENISANIGNAYKVRNFYNNIAAPQTDGEVTIDTHAIAVSYMLPLGSTSAEVKFDEGTYSFFADAYREAAKKRNVLAREMQSITWEGARAIFPANQKSEKQKQKVKDIWADYSAGKITLQEAQNNIKSYGKDLSITDWGGYVDEILDENKTATYLKELPLSSGNKPAAGQRTEGAVSGGLPTVGARAGKAVGKSPKGVKSKSSLENLSDETKRRINEQERIDSRPEKDPGELSSLLESYSSKSNGTRGITRKSVQGTKRVGSLDVAVSAEYSLDDKINSGIINAFPKFKGVQKIYEVTDPKAYRQMMMESLKDNPFAASVTIHSEEDFGKMRMFVTEDGSTGVTLNKEGFLGGAFSNPSANRPQNLAQLMVLGIKEGATTAEAFDTILPDYYSLFGFKAVSRTSFNDEYRPQVSNGNTIKDWDYETYKRFNNGRPDVVFFIYDGGDRNTIENKLGSFDTYNAYDKFNTKSFDENGYDSAEEIMKQQAVKRLEVDLGIKPEIKSKAQLADNNAKEVADLYAKMREGGGWSERQKINAILDGDPKLSYIYNNFKEITRMLEDAQLLTKSGNCP